MPLVAPLPPVAFGAAGSVGSTAGSCAREAGGGEGAPRAPERLLEENSSIALSFLYSSLDPLTVHPVNPVALNSD